MKRLLVGCCMVMASTIMYGMEELDMVPDQKTLMAQIAAVTRVCFKKHSYLTEQEQEYVCQTIAEEYGKPDNPLIRDLQRNKLKYHEAKLQASVVSKIEHKVNYFIYTISSENSRLKFEQEEQRASSYRSTALLSSIAGLFLYAVLFV